jgi:hypothetical protein
LAFLCANDITAPDDGFGVDTAASGRESTSDSWVYGHSTFGMVAGQSGRRGAFTWLRHRGHEATRLWLATGALTGWMTTRLRASKADAQALLFQRQRPRRLLRLTTPRQGADQRPARTRMSNGLPQRQTKRVDKPRRSTIEPRHG